MSNTPKADVTFKPATKEDSRTIAELYSLSSDGVADYIWTTMAEEGEDILDVGEQRYSQENTDFSYQNCTLAEIEGKTVGMLVAFPVHVDEEIDFLSIDPVLVPYCKLEEDKSYYICGVSVFEEHRNQGIGQQFMKIAEDKAKEAGLKKISLIVFEENVRAKALYERLGYKEVARETIVAHPLIHFTGDALLMVKSI